MSLALCNLSSSLLTFPVAAGFVIAYLLYYYASDNRKQLPPGPVGLPIVGYIPFLPDSYGDKLTSLFEKYGDIFSVRLGSTDVVFLADYDLIKQSFLKDVFNHRPSFSFFSSILPASISDWNGEEFTEQRKFSIRVLKNLGVGKQVVEDRILDEINLLMDQFKKANESPIEAMRLIGSSISNVINLLIMGERFEYDHPTRKMLDDVFLIREKIPSVLGTLNYIPAISKLLHYVPCTPIGKLVDNTKKVECYLKNRIKVLEESLDMRSPEATCFIEAYLKEMASNESGGKFFDEYHLIGNAITFLQAASMTTGDFLVWFLLYMMVHPDVQEKLRNEVDRVVGKDRISALMKQHMPYTEAVMLELHCHVSPAPIGVIHAVGQDAKLGQYLLSQGTHVIIGIFRVHQDPKYFSDPEIFDPERFISSEGTFVRDEHVIPFGSGRRSCPGEPIANSQVFLYIVSFIQRFIIQPPAGRVYTTAGVMEFIGRNPKDAPVEVIFKARHG